MEKQYHSYIAMSVKFSQFFHSPRGKEGDLSKLGEPFDLAQDMLCELCARHSHTCFGCGCAALSSLRHILRFRIFSLKRFERTW
jgi:hypothetical protein